VTTLQAVVLYSLVHKLYMPHGHNIQVALPQ